MPSTGFSYVVKNRLGIYYLQLRIPKHIRDNRPDLKPPIRKSLRTRNRRDALRFARKLVVWMEDNDFQKSIASWEDEARRCDELFHIGLPLYELVTMDGKKKSPTTKALIESATYRLGEWNRGSEFFVPLIALFTGMTRIPEKITTMLIE